MISTAHPIFFRVFKSTRMRWVGHLERRKTYKGFLWGNLRKRDGLGDRRRWDDNNKMDLQELGCGVWTGWSWRRIGTGGVHL